MTEQHVFSDRELTEKLRSACVRPSLHRLAVLDVIANGRTHPSADDIFRHISGLYPGVSRTTVYNALHTLADTMLVKLLDIDPEMAHYDFAWQPDHSHFMCRKCGRITDMALPRGLQTAPPPGHRIESLALNTTAICLLSASRENNRNFT